MNVAQLIEELKKCNPKALCLVPMFVGGVDFFGMLCEVCQDTQTETVFFNHETKSGLRCPGCRSKSVCRIFIEKVECCQCYGCGSKWEVSNDAAIR